MRRLVSARRLPEEGRVRTTRTSAVLLALLCAVCAVCAVLGPPPMRSALAHHSFAMYDQTKLVVITGSIKEFQWSNPHALIWLIKDPPTGGGAPAGEDLWSIELPTSPGVLRKLGWTKHSLEGGERVAVEINPLRSGEHGGSFKKATKLATGEVLTAITSGLGGAGGAGGGGGGPGAAPPPSPKAKP